MCETWVNLGFCISVYSMYPFFDRYEYFKEERRVVGYIKSEGKLQEEMWIREKYFKQVKRQGKFERFFMNGGRKEEKV